MGSTYADLHLTNLSSKQTVVDLLVDPRTRWLVVNPAYLNYPVTSVK